MALIEISTDSYIDSDEYVVAYSIMTPGLSLVEHLVNHDPRKHKSWFIQRHKGN